MVVVVVVVIFVVVVVGAKSSFRFPSGIIVAPKFIDFSFSINFSYFSLRRKNVSSSIFFQSSSSRSIAVVGPIPLNTLLKNIDD